MLIKQWEITEIKIKRCHDVLTYLTLISEWLKAKWKKFPVSQTHLFHDSSHRSFLPDFQKVCEVIPDVAITNEV